MRVDIALFGGFAVAVDGQRIPDASWRRRHASALVKLLALSPGRRLPRDHVIDALWPDLLVDEAAPRLHKAAHYARVALAVPEGVVLAGEVVSLAPAAEVKVDVDEFDALVDAYRSGGGLARAAEAIQLYRGDLLPDDLYEPWTEAERDRRRMWYLDLLRDSGRWEDVLAIEPLDEEARLRLVNEHIQRGDRSAALNQLEQMEQVWRRELGAEPGEAALALRAEALGMPVYDGNRVPRGPRRATPVPPPATPTIGRERDIELVMALLTQSQIVTLMGVGGVGKTRLAAEVAHRHIELTSRHGCFVDLTKVPEAGLVPELMIRELGIHVGSVSTVEQMLEEALRGQPCLLVLDNFEHVIDAAGIVADIVKWSPDARVLVTSRARLRLSGEQVFDVSPLPYEPGPGDARIAGAVALFEQVATAIDPHFRLEPSLDDVVAICRSVDGLPLAIELAAGHLRTLPPALLRMRLSARLGSPMGAARDAPARQQTIPATIDWSLQLLGAPERRLFARLGIFNGSVELEAVEQVCADDDEDLVDVLSRLIDQSLVRRVTGRRGEPRFVLLDLVRERARVQLEGQHEAIADRHAAYLASFVEDIEDRRWTDAANTWIDLMTEMLGEIRAAHAWAQQRGNVFLCARIAAGLGSYWHLEGHHVEGRRWVEEILEPEADLDDRLRARIQLTAGFLGWPRSRFISRTHWEQAIDLFRSVGDTRLLAYTLALASVTYLGEPDHYDFAMRLNDEGVELARQVGERPLIAQTLNVRGELTRVAGHDALALAAYEEGRDLSIAIGDDAYVAMFLANLSYLAEHRGEYAEARRMVCEAIRLCWALGRRVMAVWCVSDLAGPELGLGRHRRAAVLIGAADQALRVLGVARHPGDLPEHDRVVSRLRAVIGEESLRLLEAEGARLSLDDAVALALADAADLDADPSTVSSSLD